MENLKISYGIMGAILALGSPFGWMFLRCLSSRATLATTPVWISEECASSLTLYLYIWIGTTTAFTGFWFWLGHLYGRLQGEYSILNKFYGEVRSLALVDPLTGLGNFRGYGRPSRKG